MTPWTLFRMRNIGFVGLAVALAMSCAAVPAIAKKQVMTMENSVGVIVHLPVSTQTYRLVVPPMHGQVIVGNSRGTYSRVVYTPDADFTGTDSFSYAAGVALPVIVTVTVNSDPNDAVEPPTVDIVDNQLVGADGKPFLVRGLIMRPVITTALDEDGAFTKFGDAELDAAASWGANTVRLLASQVALDPQGSLYSAQYVQSVANAATQVLNHGFVLIVGVNDELTDGETTLNCLPTAATQRAWNTLLSLPFAQADFRRNVMFELFNEPVSGAGKNKPDSIWWPIWQNGGTVSSYQVGQGQTCAGGTKVGMNQLIAQIRNAGADNIVIADGLGWAHWLNPAYPLHDPNNRLAYAAHPFLEAWPGFTLTGDPAHDTTMLDHAFGDMQSKGPVIATAVGGGAETGSQCMANAPAVMPTLLAYLRNKNMGAVGWAFDLPPIALTKDWNFTPTSYSNFKCPANGVPGQGGPGELFQQWFLAD